MDRINHHRAYARDQLSRCIVVCQRYSIRVQGLEKARDPWISISTMTRTYKLSGKASHQTIRIFLLSLFSLFQAALHSLLC
jgi:hypothetical protein